MNAIALRTPKAVLFAMVTAVGLAAPAAARAATYYVAPTGSDGAAGSGVRGR